MTKSIASLLLLVVVAVVNTNGVSAFTSIQTPQGIMASSRTSTTNGRTAFEMPTATSTTALNLKVKVDPEAVKKANNKGNAKMAAYGGSVAIAVALPFLFLIWSALK
mmetsp:Transcript_7257/g.11038  ORF Transcript_7257/g.11038 Transcript_7257/m.11038 type:complete len:107 (-) Transcript_7257:242-562(-)|eukprot:CAMPEP_0195295418 /NCGR_PEP_ID=MMETSP0707-20130614/17351_1 /TAXON_ID=33640 /ORGANISM="Asterionellopsis glacialis, Strain CCMP134" /LENGTH=106 /DNA_ID=CAMNT_0040356647 /DNA_START=167 /DNA_END=487 /DNA_ORIENTATION=+